MDNVVSIIDVFAIKEIAKLLQLSKNDAQAFHGSLKNGKTLAEALREIGISSGFEIDMKIWPRLRAWRNHYFPNNVKYKI